MFDNSSKNTTTEISDFGEFGLINHLTKKIEFSNKETIFGIGDDAAVLDSKSKKMVVSTDSFSEGVHFDFSYCPLKHIGYKAITTSISDIFAMNAVPSQVLVSIAVSNKISVETLEGIYEGINLACKMYSLDFVGGDTTTSLAGIIITVTTIGYANKEDIVYRSGAKENDLICVTGNLGAAYLGLHFLEREKEVAKENKALTPDFSGYEYLLERQLKPEAQKWLIAFLKDNKIKVNAMIDISDGLSSEILHLCNSSEVGCLVYEDKIPIDPSTVLSAEEFNILPIIAAMNGGDDYEMLFTVPTTAYDKIKTNKEITVIGHIVEKAQKASLVMKGSNSLQTIEAQGWNPIKMKAK